MTHLGRILIVDDEPKIRSFIGRALTAAGYATEFAASGTEALHSCAAARYDLVILDLVIGDMDGRQVLGELLFARPDQAVIVLSCVADVAAKVDLLERGVPGVRLYLNNGQSVITDSEGLYNFPAVNEGSQVISLDPVTLPAGYALADTGRSDERSWTRLLRTPLGGGALLRQNFALRSPDSEHVGSRPSSNASGNAYASANSKSNKSALNGSLFGGVSNNLAGSNDSKESNITSAPKPSVSNAPTEAGTYEMK